jgi:hypothetical protein
MEPIIDESEEYLNNKNINTQLEKKISPKMIFIENKIPT